MEKRLVILPETANEEDLREKVRAGDDILAITPAAMLSVETAGFSFKAIEDFYPVDAFREDLLDLNKNIAFRWVAEVRPHYNCLCGSKKNPCHPRNPCQKE